MTLSDKGTEQKKTVRKRETETKKEQKMVNPQKLSFFFFLANLDIFLIKSMSFLFIVF